MAIFTVHVPHDDADAFSRADRTTFVRDGFSLWAFLFGPLYLLRCRAWLAAALWLIVGAAGLWLCRLAALPWSVVAGLGLLLALFTGLEANSLRRYTLNRRGLDVVDVVEAPSREEGERAFFRKATAGGLPPRRTVERTTVYRPEEPVIGFFEDGPRP